MNLLRPSLVQILSLVAALVTQFLNASWRAGGTMLFRQLVSSLRPEEESRPVTPVLLRHAVASSLAFATADDVASDVACDATLEALPLLHPAPAPAMITSAAAAGATYHFPDIPFPPCRKQGSEQCNDRVLKAATADSIDGQRLAAPDEGWRDRGDMDPQGTRLFRASVVARSRFVEDLVAEQAGRGVAQYVMLGAGLDTFAQRQPELASRMWVFDMYLTKQANAATLRQLASLAPGSHARHDVPPPGRAPR